MRSAAPTKAETSLLAPFAGLPLERIFVPRTHSECVSAAGEIRAAGLAGFDTESRPTFARGEISTGPHVVQFALSDKAYIFQLHRQDCLGLVADLLQSETVFKVGFGLKSDRKDIVAKFGVKPRGIIDLDHAFRKIGYRSQIGVRAAIGALLKQSFSKSKRTTTSNWSLPTLTSAQLLYAANDAYAALCVLEALRLAHPEVLRSYGLPPSPL